MDKWALAIACGSVAGGLYLCFALAKAEKRIKALEEIVNPDATSWRQPLDRRIQHAFDYTTDAHRAITALFDYLGVRWHEVEAKRYLVKRKKEKP